MGFQDFIDDLSLPTLLVGAGFIVVIGFIISIVQETKAKKREKRIKAKTASAEKTEETE